MSSKSIIVAKSFTLFCAIILLASCNPKAPKETKEKPVVTNKYLKKQFGSSTGQLNYRVMYPNGFDLNKKYPVFVFMHGAGERGDDNEAQLVHGSERIKNGMNEFNSIAIFPQCPKEDYWVPIIQSEPDENGERNYSIDVSGPPTNALQRVIELIESLKEKPFIDNSKIYVSGLSMGGMATFDLVWRMPSTFAAAAAICGAGSPEKAKIFGNLPIRIFHGEADGVVPVSASKTMENALNEAGGNPEVFYYPEVNHNSWDNAFAEPDFISWFFKHEK